MLNSCSAVQKLRLRLFARYQKKIPFEKAEKMLLEVRPSSNTPLSPLPNANDQKEYLL